MSPRLGASASCHPSRCNIWRSSPHSIRKSFQAKRFGWGAQNLVVVEVLAVPIGALASQVAAEGAWRALPEPRPSGPPGVAVAAPSALAETSFARPGSSTILPRRSTSPEERAQLARPLNTLQTRTPSECASCDARAATVRPARWSKPREQTRNVSTSCVAVGRVSCVVCLQETKRKKVTNNPR